MCLHQGRLREAPSTHDPWKVDFVYDQRADSRPFRILGVVDQCGRPSSVSEPRQSSGDADDAAVLDQIIVGSVAPVSNVLGQGTAMAFWTPGDWACHRGPCATSPSICSKSAAEMIARRSCAQCRSTMHLRRSRPRTDYNQRRRYRPRGQLPHLRLRSCAAAAAAKRAEFRCPPNPLLDPSTNSTRAITQTGPRYIRRSRREMTKLFPRLPLPAAISVGARLQAMD